MEKITCKACGFYRQHYVMDNRKIFRVFCGHCVRYPTKNRKPDAIACDKFTEAEPNEFAFVSKEYLSKELLKYVLNLELFPSIEDAAEK